MNAIKYDEVLQKFYVEHVLGGNVLVEYIALTNREYFCNKSWTLSFNMNTRSWVSFHSYIPNFYIAENNFFYSGLNEGCDLAAIAAVEIPTPATTTTTTTVLYCNLIGTAVNTTPTTTTTTTPTPPVYDCTLTAGSAVVTTYDCTLTAGSAVLITYDCTLNPGSAIIQ